MYSISLFLSRTQIVHKMKDMQICQEDNNTLFCCKFYFVVAMTSEKLPSDIINTYFDFWESRNYNNAFYDFKSSSALHICRGLHLSIGFYSFFFLICVHPYTAVCWNVFKTKMTLPPNSDIWSSGSIRIFWSTFSYVCSYLLTYHMTYCGILILWLCQLHARTNTHGACRKAMASK